MSLPPEEDSNDVDLDLFLLADCDDREDFLAENKEEEAWTPDELKEFFPEEKMTSTVDMNISSTDFGASPPSSLDGILLPSQKDILLGRGKRTQYHPGNDIWLSLLLKDKITDFDRGRRKEKKVILFAILDQVKNNGGQFLKKGKMDTGKRSMTKMRGPK